MKVLLLFQPEGGPSKGLLHDYEPSAGPSFEALVSDKSNKLFTGKSWQKRATLYSMKAAFWEGDEEK